LPFSHWSIQFCCVPETVMLLEGSWNTNYTSLFFFCKRFPHIRRFHNLGMFVINNMEHFIVMEKDTRAALRAVMPYVINYNNRTGYISLCSFSIVTDLAVHICLNTTYIYSWSFRYVKDVLLVYTYRFTYYVKFLLSYPIWGDRLWNMLPNYFRNILILVAAIIQKRDGHCKLLSSLNNFYGCRNVFPFPWVNSTASVV
jgi:hypothetical protein